MTEEYQYKNQYKMRYQVYANDGYRSTTNDLGTAKVRANFYQAKDYKNVTVWESTETGRSMIYKPKA